MNSFSFQTSYEDFLKSNAIQGEPSQCSSSSSPASESGSHLGNQTEKSETSKPESKYFFIFQTS